MSQELLALIGQKELELSRLRTAHQAVQQEFQEFKQFVIDAVSSGRGLTLVEDVIENTRELSGGAHPPEPTPAAQPPSTDEAQATGELAPLNESP